MYLCGSQTWQKTLQWLFRTSIATGEDPPYDLERDLGESESHGILAAKKFGCCAAMAEPRNHGKTMGKPWEKHGKMVVVQNVHGILWDLPNLVMTVTVCDIEHDRRNSGFSHETWWFSSAMLVITRGSSLKIWQFEGKTMTMETKAQKNTFVGWFLSRFPVDVMGIQYIHAFGLPHLGFTAVLLLLIQHGFQF